MDAYRNLSRRITVELTHLVDSTAKWVHTGHTDIRRLDAQVGNDDPLRQSVPVHGKLSLLTVNFCSVVGTRGNSKRTLVVTFAV
jgi:hypothetical protein